MACSLVSCIDRNFKPGGKSPALSAKSRQVFITNGWLSDLVIVVAVTNREASTAAHGISLFLVENGMKGFHKGRKLEKIGLKAQVTADGSELPPDHCSSEMYEERFTSHAPHIASYPICPSTASRPPRSSEMGSLMILHSKQKL